MATQVQWRGGSAAENDAFTGAIREVTVDTTNKELRVHDGFTAGGVATAKKSDLQTHVADVGNPHAVTKAQVGLGNVDNTADLDKPISTATQAALDDKADAAAVTAALADKADTSYVDAQLADKADKLPVVPVAFGTTLASGNHYRVTAAGQTFLLPAGAETGDLLRVNVGAFSDTVIDPNGSTILEDSDTRIINKEQATVTFFYNGSTWEVF